MYDVVADLDEAPGSQRFSHNSHHCWLQAKMAMMFVQNLWHCDGVSDGFRHRSRIRYLHYGVISFIPKLLHMQYVVQDASCALLPSVAVAGAREACMLLAGLVGWYSLDRVTEANLYVLEDPKVSGGLFKLLSSLILACYLCPVLFFGQAQLVAEGLAVIISCYYSLWVPLMDSFLEALSITVVFARFYENFAVNLRLYRHDPLRSSPLVPHGLRSTGMGRCRAKWTNGVPGPTNRLHSERRTNIEAMHSLCAEFQPKK